MDLKFDVGNPEAAAGHGLIYFTAASEGRIFATYALVLPIPVNLEKYIPPAFASMVPSNQTESEAATPIPPVAEEVESVQWLRRLADARRDDLVDAGLLYSVDMVNLVQMTQEAALEYGRISRNQTVPEPVHVPSPVGQYVGLSEAEKLNQLTMLVGRLRDTLGTPESEPVQAELRELASALPSKYRVEELLEWAVRPGSQGQQLATLHLQRSYKILNEEYLDVADIDRQIGELQAS